MTQSFDPGDRLGRYELLKVIGGGGFASVWRARTVGPGGFEREVAIKVMRPGRASQKRFQDMLLDEARLVARIHHPNVAQIWEVGEDPRSLYFVMELVDGESLDELRYRAEEVGKELPARAVFRVLADTCAGLHAAHELSVEGVEQGLVHRDVSPQNILVARQGTTKLIDFGIAKAKERLAADTTTGFIKGKIAYMAPEQARTEEMDRRADLWAIGAVAYDLIEGRPPFEGHTDLGRLAALSGPAAVPPMRGSLPEPLKAVVMRTLEKDRDKRYATALELKLAIEEALIESELETSAEDVATLLRPYFRAHVLTQVSPPSSPEGAAIVDGEATTESSVASSPKEHTVERAVTSTIQAKARSGTIEIPKNKRSYLPVLAALGVPLVLGAVWWLSSGNATTAAAPRAPRSAASVAAAALSLDGRAGASSAASKPASAAPIATSSEPIASQTATTISAAPPSASAVAVTTAAPSAQRPTKIVKPRPTVDENAIE